MQDGRVVAHGTRGFKESVGLHNANEAPHFVMHLRKANHRLTKTDALNAIMHMQTMLSGATCTPDVH